MARKETRLPEPACAMGCDPCFRRCALARIQIGWWEREEERLLRARVRQTDPCRGEWLADLREAQEHLQRLRQETKPFAPSFHAGALPGGFRESPARVRLH